jgi:hypothetical protein
MIVFVPRPRGSEDQIARLHETVLAVCHCDSTVPGKHESQRRKCVAVGRRMLSGFQDLKRGGKGRGGEGGAGQRRMA